MPSDITIWLHEIVGLSLGVLLTHRLRVLLLVWCAVNGVCRMLQPLRRCVLGRALL